MSHPLSHLTRLEPEAGSSSGTHSRQPIPQPDTRPNSRQPSPQPDTRPSQPDSNFPRDASRNHSPWPSPEPNSAPHETAGGPSQPESNAPRYASPQEMASAYVNFMMAGGVFFLDEPNGRFTIDMTGSTLPEVLVRQLCLWAAEVWGVPNRNLSLRNGVFTGPLQVDANVRRSSSAERANSTPSSVPGQPRPAPGDTPGNHSRRPSPEPPQVDANVRRSPSAEHANSTSSGVPGQPRPAPENYLRRPSPEPPSNPAPEHSTSGRDPGQPRPPPRGSTPGESPVNSTAFWFHHLRIVEDHPGRPDSAPYGVYTAPGNRHAISTLDITDFEMDRNELSRRIQQVRQGSHQPPRGFADYIFNDDFGVLLYTDNDGRIVNTWTNGVADRIPAFRDDSIRENSTVVWYRLLALRAGMRFSSVGTPGNAEDMANSYLRSHPLGVLDISNMDFSETQMSDRIEIIPRSDIPNTTDVFRSRHGRHAWEVLIQDGDTADLVWTRGRRPNGRMGRSSTNNAPQPTGSPVIGSSTFIGRNSTNDAPRPTGNRDAIVQFWGQALSRFPCEIDRDNTSGTCTFVLTEADQEADLMLQVLETARTPNCPYPVRILRADRSVLYESAPWNSTWQQNPPVNIAPATGIPTPAPTSARSLPHSLPPRPRPRASDQGSSCGCDCGCAECNCGANDSNQRPTPNDPPAGGPSSPPPPPAPQPPSPPPPPPPPPPQAPVAPFLWPHASWPVPENNGQQQAPQNDGTGAPPATFQWPSAAPAPLNSQWPNAAPAPLNSQWPNAAPAPLNSQWLSTNWWSTGNAPATGIPTTRWVPPQSNYRVVQQPFIPAQDWGTLYNRGRAAAPLAPPCQQYYPQMQCAPYAGGCHPDLSGESSVRWPVFMPPGMAQATRSGLATPTAPFLDAVATYPPACNLVVIFEASQLMHWQQRWGPIRVPVHTRWVTVRDVLDAIYAYVGQPLLQADLLAISPQERGKVETASARRQRMSSPFARTEFLRADVFEEWVFFGGVMPVDVRGNETLAVLRLVPGL